MYSECISYCLLIKYPEQKLLGLLRLKQNNKKSEALILNEDVDEHGNNLFAVSPNGSVTGKSSPNIGGNMEYKHISALILDHFSLYQLGLLVNGEIMGLRKHLICWLVIWMVVFAGGLSGSVCNILYLGQKYFSFVSISVIIAAVAFLGMMSIYKQLQCLKYKLKKYHDIDGELFSKDVQNHINAVNLKLNMLNKVYNNM